MLNKTLKVNGHTLASNTKDPEFVKSYARCTGCGQIILSSGRAIEIFKNDESACSRNLDNKES